MRLPLTYLRLVATICCVTASVENTLTAGTYDEYEKAFCLTAADRCLSDCQQLSLGGFVNFSQCANSCESDRELCRMISIHGEYLDASLMQNFILGCQTLDSM